MKRDEARRLAAALTDFLETLRDAWRPDLVPLNDAITRARSVPAGPALVEELVSTPVQT